MAVIIKAVVRRHPEESFEWRVTREDVLGTSFHSAEDGTEGVRMKQ